MFTHTLISITRGKVSIFVCVCVLFFSLWSQTCCDDTESCDDFTSHDSVSDGAMPKAIIRVCNYGDDEFIRNSDFVGWSDNTVTNTS